MEAPKNPGRGGKRPERGKPNGPPRLLHELLAHKTTGKLPEPAVQTRNFLSAIVNPGAVRAIQKLAQQKRAVIQFTRDEQEHPLFRVKINDRAGDPAIVYLVRYKANPPVIELNRLDSKAKDSGQSKLVPLALLPQELRKPLLPGGIKTEIYLGEQTVEECATIFKRMAQTALQFAGIDVERTFNPKRFKKR